VQKILAYKEVVFLFQLLKFEQKVTRTMYFCYF
jgi:hypothetical protein